MPKKPLGKRHLAASFLCGAVLFSGLSAAAATPTGSSVVSAVSSKLTFFAFGERQAVQTPTGSDGTLPPQSLVYNGTTYVPLRAIGDMLGVPVYWDATNNAVSAGQAKTIVKNADGKVLGSIDFTAEDKGVRANINLTGLPPGKHGIHIHQSAIKGSDFETAKSHFNPTGHQHGHDNPKGAHLGDFTMNLTASSTGSAKAEMFLEGVNLKRDSSMSIAGRSVIIHAGLDDQKTDPSGDSGDRIAGGNIPK
ncbi:superoxide dismutase family protein [Saccharibacillus sp. CPCC 101409]|uniref:superoxide dismutase family protein n=1 Tax=Saccharibacillus sp. CPCC 101409 TaxID=3058041 RepID=UPI0026738332|nr:superoxide dismutase family protein [Saccharibacillus sp. CPCC 101409]MDO3408353.1 superoxide dismutase family protein [Saccharibacillus sp. CPCC 101409]